MCLDKNKIRSKEDLIALSVDLSKYFSFGYKTIADARKIIRVGIYTYEFDSTTLYPYSYNLNSAEMRELHNLMTPFYTKMRSEDREAYKELHERRDLLLCLLCAPMQYRDLEIIKRTRPDFILSGDKKIGVEVTELITEYDKKVFALPRYIEKRGLDSKEAIQEYIRQYHRSIADRVEIVPGIVKPMISSGMHCLTPNRQHFAEEIKRKYDMYKDTINEYDEFIILGNANTGAGIDISSQEEVQEVIDYLLKICPDIINITTIISWRDQDKPGKIIHTWYKMIE